MESMDSAPACGLWSLVIINSHLLGPFHIASNVFIFGGFWLLSSAWKVLYEAHLTPGSEYADYAARTPRFFPAFGALTFG